MVVKEIATRSGSMAMTCARHKLQWIAFVALSYLPLKEGLEAAAFLSKYTVIFAVQCADQGLAFY